MSRSYSHCIFIFLGLIFFECATAFFFGHHRQNGIRATKTKSMPLDMIFNTPDSGEREASYRNIVASMFQQQPINRHEHQQYRQLQHQQHQYQQRHQPQPQQYHQQFDNSNSIRAAVKTQHMIDYVDVPIEPTNFVPQTILVESHRIPLNILFQSRSSNLNIQNDHQPSQGSFQESSSEDEPHRLFHRVTKPIIQEVYELITPYRKITQEIQPVQEDIQTIVSRAVQSDNKYIPVNPPQQQQQQLPQQQQQPQKQNFIQALKTPMFKSTESPMMEHHLYGASYAMPSQVEPDLFTNVIPGSRSLLEREREPTERFHRPLNKNSYILSMPHSLLPEPEHLFTNIPAKTPFLYQPVEVDTEPGVQIMEQEQPTGNLDAAKTIERTIEPRMVVTSTTTPLDESEEDNSTVTPAPSTTTTVAPPTTTVRPESTEVAPESNKTQVSSGTDGERKKIDAVTSDVAGRMLMMYSGGGSLFLAKPEPKSSIGSMTYLRQKNSYSEVVPSGMDSASY